MILIHNRLQHYRNRKCYGTDYETERKPDVDFTQKPNHTIRPLWMCFFGDTYEPSVIMSLRIYNDRGDRITPSSLMNSGTIVASYFILFLELDRNLCFDYSLIIYVILAIIKTSQLQHFSSQAFNFIAYKKNVCSFRKLQENMEQKA